MKVPMARPDITAAEVEAVTEVLRTPTLSIGPQLERFEEAAAAFIGARHGVGVSSGTAGLHLAVIAAGVTDGDLVITTPFSFVSSANVVLYERAERWLPPSLRGTGQAVVGRLKALLPVHSFGQPADMDPLQETAREHGLAVIEDACEAIGAEYKGRKAGTLGDVFDAWLNHTRLGFNYRLDELSAALGRAQMERLEELLAKRERVAFMYNERLAEIDNVTAPCLATSTTRMSWFVYVVRLAPHIDRAAVMGYLYLSSLLHPYPSAAVLPPALRLFRG
jgi:dTDP-4-amino-4,6-dideoxygalactose transaminase